MRRRRKKNYLVGLLVGSIDEISAILVEEVKHFECRLLVAFAQVVPIHV